MVSGTTYQTVSTEDSGTIGVAGNAMDVIINTHFATKNAVLDNMAGSALQDTLVVNTVPTTASVLHLKQEDNAQLTSDRLSGCCRVVASIKTNHLGTFNQISNGVITAGATESFSSAVATYDQITIDAYGNNYVLLFTPECSASTHARVNDMKNGGQLSGSTSPITRDSNALAVAGSAAYFALSMYKTGWVNDRGNGFASIVARAYDAQDQLITTDKYSGIDKLAIKVTKRPANHGGTITVGSYTTSPTPDAHGSLYKDGSNAKLKDGAFVSDTYTDALAVGWAKATSATLTFDLTGSATTTYFNTITIGYIQATQATMEPHSSDLVYAPTSIQISASADGATYETLTTLSSLTSSCDYCIHNEVVYAAAKAGVRYVKLFVTGPTAAAATSYMFDEISFTSGYSGGAGTFNDYTKAVATISNGLATFTDLSFDRYSYEGKWTFTSNVPVVAHKINFRTCYDGAVAPSGCAALGYDGTSTAAVANDAAVQTPLFNVDQLIYKRTMTIEKVG